MASLCRSTLPTSRSTSPVDGHRARLRTWLPPVVAGVLGAAPSPSLLAWLWADETVTLADLTAAEQDLIILLLLSGAPGCPRPAPALRRQLQRFPTWLASLPHDAAAILETAVEGLAVWGWLPPDLVGDDALAVLLAHLEAAPTIP